VSTNYDFKFPPATSDGALPRKFRRMISGGSVGLGSRGADHLAPFLDLGLLPRSWCRFPRVPRLHRARRDTAVPTRPAWRKRRAASREGFFASEAQRSRRSSSACEIVPASTYSSSPPSGTPRAIRLTLMPRARSISAM